MRNKLHSSSGAMPMVPELESYYLTEYLVHCPRSSNFFESQKFLRIASYVLCAVTTPVNLFGIFCILCKSPSEMLTIKWCMFYLHTLATFASAYFTIGMVPFVYFPACAGFTIGLLPYLRVPIEVQGYIGIGCLGMLALSLPILFENRQRYLVNSYKITRPTSRVIFYAFNVLFVPCSLLGPFSVVPEQTSARQLVTRLVPCPSEDFFFHSVFVLSLEHTPITAYLTALSTATVVQILFFGGHSLTFLSVGSETRSRSTRKLQRRFFLVISVQVTLPCVILFVPVVYFIFSMLSGYYNQTLNNICFLTMTLYGAIATLTMIVLHNPYQKFVLSILAPLPTRSVQVVPMKTRVRRNAVSLTTPVSF